MIAIVVGASVGCGEGVNVTEGSGVGRKETEGGGVLVGAGEGPATFSVPDVPLHLVSAPPDMPPTDHETSLN